MTRLMLESGANASHINSVNRSATQMAAFVGKSRSPDSNPHLSCLLNQSGQVEVN